MLSSRAHVSLESTWDCNLSANAQSKAVSVILVLLLDLEEPQSGCISQTAGCPTFPPAEAQELTV